jgi:alkyl hydroperoxide reductase subunit AhpC
VTRSLERSRAGVAPPGSQTRQEQRGPCRSEGPEVALEGVLEREFVDVKLSDFAGKWVVLFFYPLDFTVVCPTEIRGFSTCVAEFGALGAKVIGCSGDSKYSHLAWTERDFGRLGLPLPSDMKREVMDAYGILLEEEGIAQRGTFIIDPDGLLRYSCVHDSNIGRDTKETLRVLQALQTGEKCPLDWVPGQATLA